METKKILGLHHVTAVSSDAQKNIDFFAGILGLRLVKKTINFDAPDVYHLYFGNETGTPGTILTFFPFPGILKGRKGNGQLTVTSFSIPKHSMEYWVKRLDQFQIQHDLPFERFVDEEVIYFEDNDGLGIELVANSRDDRKGFTYGKIPLEHAIKGFYGITLSVEGYEKTAKLLTEQLDYELTINKGNRFRYSIEGKPGTFVDVLCSPDTLKGQAGAGTVHHVAFATEHSASQIEARNRLIKNGYNVTPVLDREYFRSIYFREPGGVLFEIATLPPGFTVDEDLAHLGESLKLPPWQEKNRAMIENLLPQVGLR